MEVGVKESSKLRTIDEEYMGCHVDKWKMKNWQRADAQNVEG